MDIVQIAMALAPSMRHVAGRSMPPEEAAAIMLKGYELGFNLTASMDYIKKVGEQFVLKGAGIMALLHRSQLVEITVVEQRDPKTGEPIGCTVTMKRRDSGFTHSTTFGRAEAERAGLLGKDNYKKYPGPMYLWRAVGQCAQVAVPDLFAGLHLMLEIQADAAPEPPLEIDATTGEVLA
jgi:hypothetical protein